MGNRENNLSWSWPLISLEWIPGILASVENLIEPSWIALRREMSTHVANQSFTNQLFLQLQKFFKETELIKENGKCISVSLRPDIISIKDYLFNFYVKSIRPWAYYYKFISTHRTELIFNQINANPPKQWPEIGKYKIFKQWSQFFQYTGLGFFFNNDHFIPESAITKEMCHDTKFIECCLKATGDPRYLTGELSLHTKADFLAWTKGENYLPISNDPNLFPRIPSELILKNIESNKERSRRWSNAITIAKDTWKDSLTILLSKYPFSKLNRLIFTCKYLIDFFLFGKSVHDNDFLDKDCVYSIKKRWKSVKNYRLSEQIWEHMPNLYRDTTRLFWGIAFYRNSLRNPSINDKFYDEQILKYYDTRDIKGLSIKCFRSKRTIQSIFKNFLAIHYSLMRLIENNVGENYEKKAKRIFNISVNYLPKNSLELSELLIELESLIELHPEEKSHLINFPYIDIFTGLPNITTLQNCFWIHRYYDLVETPQIKTVNKISRKLDELENKLIKDIRYYNKRHTDWDSACKQIKQKALFFKPI
jgi:hypothetical protein